MINAFRCLRHQYFQILNNKETRFHAHRFYYDYYCQHFMRCILFTLRSTFSTFSSYSSFFPRWWKITNEIPLIIRNLHIYFHNKGFSVLILFGPVYMWLCVRVCLWDGIRLITNPNFELFSFHFSRRFIFIQKSYIFLFGFCFYSALIPWVG